MKVNNTYARDKEYLESIRGQWKSRMALKKKKMARCAKLDIVG